MHSRLSFGGAVLVALAILTVIWASEASSQFRREAYAGEHFTPTPTSTPIPCTSDGGSTIEPCRMSLVITEPDPATVCAGQVCTLGSGQKFTLAVEFVSVPVGGYILAQSWIEFGDVLRYEATTEEVDEIVWPDCEPIILVRNEPQAGNTHTNHGCVTSLFSPHPASTYVGLFVEISLECSTFASSNEVFLLPDTDPTAGTSGAQYKDASGQITPEVNTLTVNCLAVPLGTSTPTPTIDPSFTNTPPPTITDTPEPGATSTPTDAGDPTPTLNATVAAMTPTQTPTSTMNQNGTPLPTSMSTPVPSTPVSSRTGDASCDGNVDPLDAALILQFAAGLFSGLPCPNEADASGDGIVDPLDAALILQFSAGLLDALPV